MNTEPIEHVIHEKDADIEYAEDLDGDTKNSVLV